MSGVAIGLAGGHPIANAAALDGLLPISPTSRRDFSVDGRVVAFLRLHQAPRRPLQPVVLEAEVIDTAGSLRWSVRRAVAAREFEAGGATDQRFDLPLTDLGVGSYVLRFVAAAGEARAQRDVRFSVQ